MKPGLIGSRRREATVVSPGYYETLCRRLVPLPSSRGGTIHVHRPGGPCGADLSRCGCVKRVVHFRNGNRLVIHEDEGS